jgi:hypothetical protein
MVKQVDDNNSPSKKQTTTQKTMTMLESNFNSVTLKINPTVMPFLTATTVHRGKKKNILRPFVAPVNHNVLNNEKAINIAHTILGNFCHGDETKNSQMETMGMDACMMIGYHNKVSKIVAIQSFYSKLEKYDHLTYHVFSMNNRTITTCQAKIGLVCIG